MSNTLSLRLRRLEQRPDMRNLYASWTDHELEARLDDVNARLEARLGMPLREYAQELMRALDENYVLPDDWEPSEALRFARLVITHVH